MLAVTTRELPTMIEAGVPDFEISSWFGVNAPRGMPQPILDLLGTILRDAMATPTMNETFSTLSAEPLVLTGAEFGRFMAGQRERFGGIIRSLCITAAS